MHCGGLASAAPDCRISWVVPSLRLRNDTLKVEPPLAADRSYQADVGLRVRAVGDDAAILDLADDGLHHRMIDAHHGEAVERHALDEVAEGVLHRIEGLEVIEMLGIDIGDDGDVGRAPQEGAVALVGFHHHPLAGAEPRIGAVGIDDAAIDHRGVEIAGVEQRRHHRRGGGLAMGAGDCDAALQAHQFGEHLGAPHHRNARRTRGHQFRIVALDGRGHHHDIGAGHVVGGMADLRQRCRCRAGA